VKPKFEDSPEGLCLTCEAPSRSEGSPKGFPRYRFGYCRRREIEAESFDFSPRQAKTNYYEINLKKKTNKIRFWRKSRAEVSV